MVNMISIILQDVVAEYIKPESKMKKIQGECDEKHEEARWNEDEMIEEPDETQFGISRDVNEWNQMKTWRNVEDRYSRDESSKI